jgi:hypothetical protein
LPQIPDEKARRYLFVAIDRATRWVYIEIYADQTEGSSVDFLAKVKAACPIKICKLLTDNGSQFTDRFTSKSKKKEPSGEHVFDRLCKQFGIEHRLIPPRHPQTNGMVERFNGRISDIVNQTRFGSAAELESTLRNFVKIYNHNIPQRALKHQTPIQALKDWREKQPDLFAKRVYNKRVLTCIGRGGRAAATRARGLALLGMADKQAADDGSDPSRWRVHKSDATFHASRLAVLLTVAVPIPIIILNDGAFGGPLGECIELPVAKPLVTWRTPFFGSGLSRPDGPGNKLFSSYHGGRQRAPGPARAPEVVDRPMDAEFIPHTTATWWA